MKAVFVSFLVISLGVGLPDLLAQSTEPVAPPFFFDQGELVYEFDLRTYTYDGGVTYVGLPEFPNIDLAEVARSEQQWSYGNWVLHRRNKHICQLRKKLSTFDPPLTAHTKYLVTRQYWRRPYSEVSLPPFQPQRPVVDSQEVHFSLPGHTGASRVILTGSFNNWNVMALPMRPGAEGWTHRLRLPPGIYEYKFIVDDEWLHDDRNPLHLTNEYKTLNSILLVGQPTTFTLAGHTQAKEVVLAGSFNSWSPTAIVMQPTATGWTVELPLPKGKHFYKFVVDGNWLTDPANPLQQYDRLGHLNSVVLVP